MTRKRFAFWIPAALLLMLFTFLLSGFSFGKKTRISGEKALEIVNKLADDSFEGRKGGLPGGKEAARWIAGRFAAWGLTPAGTDGYFQEFTHPVFHVDSARITIDNRLHKRSFAYEEEWTVQEFSGSGHIRGELIFVGYGITSEKGNWDDYAGLHVKGNVLLMIPYGAPQALYGKAGEDITLEARLKQAYERGAKAVIFVMPPADITDSFRYSFPARIGGSAAVYRDDMILAGINNDVAGFIFSNRMDNLGYLSKQIDTSGKPQSSALGVTVDITAKTTYLPEARMQNILAKIEGTDPQLKDRIIIAGGHMDHLGTLPDGTVLNGANDNASGTAVIMEVARVLKESGFRPARTILFALWDGEEQGLLGSKYYCSNPAMPLSKTDAYFNFDCIGQGDRQIYFRGIYFWPELWKILDPNFSSKIREVILPTPGSSVGSDHVSFYEAGIPGFAQVVSGGPRTGHQAKDDAQYIDPALLEINAQLLNECLMLTHAVPDLGKSADSRELYTLRSSTLVDFKPKNLTSLSEAVKEAEFIHLDIGFYPVKGDTLPDILESLEFLKKQADGDKKISVFPRTFDHQQMMDFQFGRYDRRISLIPGLDSLESLPLGFPRSISLKILARMGLAYIHLCACDLKAEDIADILLTCNEEKILVVFECDQQESIKRVVEMSLRPGLLVTESMDQGLAAILAPRQWKAALKVKAGQSPDEYITAIKESCKTPLGRNGLLIALPWPITEEFCRGTISVVSALLQEVQDTRILKGIMGDNFLSLAAFVYH